MYIQLEQIDYDAIALLIAEAENGYGCKVEYSDLMIEVEFDKEVYEHQDTDYYNGTGAWITDSVEFGICNVTSEGVDVKYNNKALEETIINHLWRR